MNKKVIGIISGSVVLILGVVGGVIAKTYYEIGHISFGLLDAETVKPEK